MAAARLDAAARCSSSVSSYTLKKTYTRTELISLNQHLTSWTPPEGPDLFPKTIRRSDQTGRKLRKTLRKTLRKQRETRQTSLHQSQTNRHSVHVQSSRRTAHWTPVRGEEGVCASILTTVGARTLPLLRNTAVHTWSFYCWSADLFICPGK